MGGNIFSVRFFLMFIGSDRKRVGTRFSEGTSLWLKAFVEGIETAFENLGCSRRFFPKSIGGILVMQLRSFLALTTVASTLVLSGCTTVQKGAAAGGAVGAASGAIIGANVAEGTVLGGALIGGGTGAGVGGLAGDAYAKVEETDMERELQNLRAQLAAKDAELAALQAAAPSPEALAEVDRLRSQLGTLQNQLAQAQNQVDAERAKAISGTGELSSLKQDLANEKGRGITLQQQLSAEQAAKQKALDELNAAKGQLAQTTTDRDKFEAQLAAATAELGKVKNDLSVIEATLKEKAQTVDGLREELSKLNIQLDETSRGLQLTIVDQLLFNPGQAQLSETGVELLGKVAAIIKQRFPDRELMIEGHTDNQPIVRSGWRSNWELGAGRALAVVHELVDYHGFKPDMLSATTFGEFRPTTTNGSETGRAENRRSVITILPEKAPIVRKQLAGL
jgi:chemotaxis protein MotB